MSEIDGGTGLVSWRHGGDGIAVVTINRPERRNALNLAVKEQLVDAIGKVGDDKAIRVIILTGAGSYFVAGTDIAEMATMTPKQRFADCHTDGGVCAPG